MNEAYPLVSAAATSLPTPPKLLDQVRGILRAKHRCGDGILMQMMAARPVRARAA